MLFQAEAAPPPAAAPPAKGKPPAAAPKGAPVATGLPYGQLAKAVAEATSCLLEQIKAFDALVASVTEACQIPDAIPSKVSPHCQFANIFDIINHIDDVSLEVASSN